MATRFYLSSTAVPPVSPAFGTYFNVQVSADRMAMSTTKDASAITSKTSGSGGGAGNKFLNRQYVSSQQLAAQTLTIPNGATNLAQVRSNLNVSTSTTADFEASLRVVSADGTTFRTWSDSTTSVLLAGGTALTTTLTNRQVFQNGTSVSVAIQDGDRLVLEMGWNYTSGTNTTRTITQSFGSAAVADLPADNTTTTASNPWFELSQDLAFQSVGGISVKTLALLGVG